MNYPSLNSAAINLLLRIQPCQSGIRFFFFFFLHILCLQMLQYHKNNNSRNNKNRYTEAKHCHPSPFTDMASLSFSPAQRVQAEYLPLFSSKAQFTLCFSLCRLFLYWLHETWYMLQEEEVTRGQPQRYKLYIRGDSWRCWSQMSVARLKPLIHYTLSTKSA